MRHYLRPLIGLLLAVGALYLLVRQIDLAATWATLRTARPGWVLAALSMVVLTVLAKVMRWRHLLGPAARGVSFGRLLAVMLSGATVNTLIPARAGDLTRAMLMGRAGVGRSYALGTILIEKVVDLAGHTLLFFCCSSRSRCPCG